MYSRHEKTIANVMTWVAKSLSTVIAAGIIGVAVREFANSRFAFGDYKGAICTLLAAVAFLSIWKFEVLSALFMAIAVLWIVASDLIPMPDRSLLLVLLLPTFLSLGGWMRRAEYHIVNRYRHSTEA